LKRNRAFFHPLPFNSELVQTICIKFKEKKKKNTNFEEKLCSDVYPRSMTRNSRSKLENQKSFQKIIKQDKYLCTWVDISQFPGNLICSCIRLQCFDGKEGVCDSTSIDHRTCTSSYWQDFTSSYRMYIPLPETKKMQQIALK